MKKYYYFSEKSLEFVEIKNFRTRSLFYLSLVALSITILLSAGFFFVTSITNSDPESVASSRENQILKTKLIELTRKYEILKNNLSELDSKTENLRIAADLEPITKEEKLLGTGGGEFDNSFDFLKSSSDMDIDNAMRIIDDVTRQFEFQKAQYDEIALKMKRNEELFECIPAIIPAKGLYIGSRFGSRLHPILKVWRRHTGIDIVANIGTPVYAPGKGKVVYIGRKGGYGLTVEIDHGFGYRTRYAHLSKVLVKKWQLVSRGDLIAKTGKSGLSNGPHLHYEVSHNGKKLNPANFFFDDLGFVELTKNN
ncbi:MAG: M23 family metallopeptidase [Ignavibacteria bacterium]|jgi:murein DD-endopeptidase MepM/ murein hydrolase activator NlpD